eukprot:m.295007 g.295007  ORF g.295007 m.295007 type:complete len:464 (+) comp13100_c0_seq1:141-1532(+)
MNEEQEQPDVVLAPHVKRASFAAIWLQGFVCGIEYAVVLPSVWEYLQGFGENRRWYLAVVLAAFSLASFTTAPAYGYLGDRWSMKRILILSNTLEVAGNILYATADSAAAVLEARLISGLGAGSGAIWLSYVARTTTTRDRTVVMALIMTARQFGLLVGPCFNFALIKCDFKIGAWHISPLSSPGLFMAIAFLITEVVLAIFLADIPVAVRPSLQQRASSVNSSEAAHEPWPVLPMAILFAMQFLVLFNQTCLETFVTPMTQDFFGWHTRENSYFYISAAAIGISTFISVRKLSTKLSDRMLLLCGMVLEVAACFWLFVWMPGAKPHETATYWKFLVGAVLIIVGITFIFIPLPSLLSKLVPAHRQATVQGLRRSVVSIGCIVGPLWAGNSGRPHLMFGVIAGFAACAFLVLLLGFGSLKPPPPLELAAIRVHEPRHQAKIPATTTYPLHHEKSPLLSPKSQS